MPITLADLTARLLAGCRPQALVALADPATGAAPTDDALAAWLGWSVFDAVLRCGGTVAAPSAPADSDLATVPDAGIPRLVAAATLAAKRNLRGSLALVDLTQGIDGQRRSQLAAQLDREIADLDADFRARFGVVAPAPPRVGALTSAADPGAGGLQPWRPAPPPPWRFP